MKRAGLAVLAVVVELVSSAWEYEIFNHHRRLSQHSQNIHERSRRRRNASDLHDYRRSGDFGVINALRAYLTKC